MRRIQILAACLTGIGSFLSAASGEGQMRATLDLAKEMGSGIARQQEMRRARGKMLFDEYKKKMGMVQADAAPQSTSAPADRQRIAEK